jgi:hypothetical protein
MQCRGDGSAQLLRQLLVHHMHRACSWRRWGALQDAALQLQHELQARHVVA